MNGFPILSLLTLVPLVGGLILLGLHSRQHQLARRLALAFSGVSLLGVLLLCGWFDTGTESMQFEERYGWIDALAVDYRLGIDGLGLLMVLLTGIVVPMALAAAGPVPDRGPAYFGLVLLLQSGLFGTFTALNFFHWFIFWELSLIPAFFLIKLWGGPQRSAAAIQFFVYTMVGSIGLLLAFLAIYLAVGTFDFMEIAERARQGTLIPALSASVGWYDLTTRQLGFVIFAAAFLGFAVKVPLVPLHTWLPAAYSEAPTATTMLLTGLMSKMGVYGFIRIVLPIFPEALRWVSVPLLWLAVITVVVSAAAALAQRDLKRMLAYSSINHLGYCLLGLFAITSGAAGELVAVEKSAALSGVFLQMFNHGLTAAALFWFVALIEKRSGGLRGLGDFGGLRTRAPVLCGLMGIALFSSLGLPGLNGFVGEFLIFKGVFGLTPWAATLSTLGLLLTAVFILTMIQRVFFGPVNPAWSGFSELTVGERWQVAPVIGLMFLIGIYPQAILGFTNRTVVTMIKAVGY